MDPLVYKKIFLTKGVGTAKEKLSSFEMALPRAQGIRRLQAGQIIFCVLARAETDERNRLVCASIGLAIPRDTSKFGYISEHHAFGQTAREAGDYAEDLAASMLATTLGIPFDIDQAWDERKEIFKMGGHIVNTKDMTQTARGHGNKNWTTVISAAVFVP